MVFVFHSLSKETSKIQRNILFVIYIISILYATLFKFAWIPLFWC